MLADFSMFETLKSEEGVDISQTAQDFHSAVDHGCGFCSEIRGEACISRKKDREISQLFCYRPESPSSGRRNLIKNIRLETMTPDSYDVKLIELKIGSAGHRCELVHKLNIEAQEGKHTSCQVRRYAFGDFSNTFGKTIRQRSTSAPGR